MLTRNLLMTVLTSTTLWIAFLLFNAGVGSTDVEQHTESLDIKVLPNGLQHAYFQFSVTGSDKSRETGQYTLFPKSLGEILSKYQVHEFDLSLTQGIWRYPLWGMPFKDSVNPSGAEIFAVFQHDAHDIEALWTGLVNSLSGLICASLNFIDSKVTTSPQYSMLPCGAVRDGKLYDHRLARYAILPQENVCTENLTPWKKLLPCHGKAGLSSLLSAKPLFDSNYHSMSVMMTHRCFPSKENCSSTTTELRQTVSVVLGNNRKQSWSMKKLFDVSPGKRCQMASSSVVKVHASPSAQMKPKPLHEKSGMFAKTFTYDYDSISQLEVVDDVSSTTRASQRPPMYAHRYLSGYGQEEGSIVCEITNHHDEPVQIVYMEYLPWFTRVYLHTLKAENEQGAVKLAKVKYTPAVERQSPYLIEMLLTLTPNSTTSISFNIEKLFLRWTEYPPDANLGFYIPSSIITAVVPDADEESSLVVMKGGYGVVRIYTEKLLLALPTPDFSMPYNVICLTCTVVAIAFGSLHNLTTKVLTSEQEKPSLPKRIVNYVKKVLGFSQPENVDVVEEESKEELAKSDGDGKTSDDKEKTSESDVEDNEKTK